MPPQPEALPPSPPKSGGDYVELRCRSAFSFLDGASLPEDLFAHAGALGYSALALADRDGLYGSPRFFHSAVQTFGALPGSPQGAERRDEETMDAWVRTWPLRPIIGAVVSLAERDALGPAELLILVENREGYRNLSRLLTRARLREDSPPSGKVEPSISLPLVAEYARGLVALVGGGGGRDPVGMALGRGDDAGARRALDPLLQIFGAKGIYLEVERHLDADEELRNHRLLQLGRYSRLPIVATNDVRYATAADHRLHDVLTCARHRATVDEIGRRLPPSGERWLKPPAEMARLFADLPGAVRRTREVADRCAFTLANLGYRFPEYPVPAGESEQSWLEKLTWERALDRFRPLTEKVRTQLRRELELIGKLQLAGYFLIVWDIVAWCRRSDILVQGRGSAANSAVCYALGITAVDPVRMGLLFERFLSEERGEWPDIDLDLPSGDKRERVIQYVYHRYGRLSAAMTANVITYRPKMAVRDAGRALGFSEEQLGQMSRHLGGFEFRDPGQSIGRQLAEAGFSPDGPDSDSRTRLLVELSSRLLNLPRHLGQHSGGMVIAAGRLDNVVPLEPASMPGRVVVQWDKEDCADLGIIKIDLLGLGMMAVLEDSVALVQRHEDKDVDLAHLPHDDPAVYDLLQRADTVGTFQVESRAQMATLPRMKPACFYDLVIEIAIIRPGPIVGGMLNPYLRRRTGHEAPDPLHPCLEEVLGRTLGVPLFQEQLMRMAMVAAGFTGGEAEELRRAMGFKRSAERMAGIEVKLRRGMERRGIDPEAQDKIVKSITSFALYGFPESHSASFALIAFASCWLKVHHGAAFFAALLNNWPMGFYHPSSLVRDATRRGVRFLPIDVTRSSWACTLERLPVVGKPAGQGSDLNSQRRSDPKGELAVRLGLKYVKGLGEELGRRIESARAHRMFASVDDLVARVLPPKAQMVPLAEVGALAGLGLSRRSAVWQVETLDRSGPLFDQAGQAGQAGTELRNETPSQSEAKVAFLNSVPDPPDPRSPLDEMDLRERMRADYRVSGVSTGPHPMALRRDELRRAGVRTASELPGLPDRTRVRIAGAVIVRQRPGSAKGFFFLTLEDETGLTNAIVTPAHFMAWRTLLVSSPSLVIEGVLQTLDGAISVKADRFFPLDEIAPPARNFH